MGFFDFLKGADNAETAEARIAAIAEDLQSVESERVRLHGELATHSARRKGMLVDPSVSEETLIKADMAAERHHARLERLDELERLLQSRLQAAEKEVAERAMRVAFDERHTAASAFHAAMGSAVDALEKLKNAHESFDAAARRAGHSPNHFHDGNPFVVSEEFIADFGRRLASARQHEDARRVRIDGGEQ
ncbi:MAG: hypothetical protein ACR652_15070 [Methylocystis sp.]|uniref:hypothetical protein n=1 Tax=Methylocystis sp. TaxID=1911079 RepID=UPI003DA4992E